MDDEVESSELDGRSERARLTERFRKLASTGVDAGRGVRNISMWPQMSQNSVQ